MKNFVHHRGRSASPQNGQSTAPTERRTLGANAKVPMKRTVLSHRPPSQQSGLASHRNEGQANLLARQEPLGRGHGAQKRDQYDTDAESLDTTVHQSDIRFGHGEVQQQQLRRDLQYSVEDEEQTEDQNDEESRYEESEIGEEHVQQMYEYLNLHEHHPSTHLRIVRDYWERNGFAPVDGDSYPTTSIGPDEHFDHDKLEDDKNGAENVDNGQLVSVPQEPGAKISPATQVVLEPLRRPPSANSAPRFKSTIFQTGASLRVQQRSNNHNNIQGGAAYPTNLPAPSTSQPPTYSQANHDHVPNSSVHINQSQVVPSQVPGISHSEPNIANLPPQVHSKQASAATREPEDSFHHHRDKQQTQDSVIGPVEDYDKEILFGMKYDELKNESFDVIPRATAPVLTEEMMQKPLDERLNYVKKSLEPRKQKEFFRALPTAEWEEAGDWFLDQFSELLQKNKAARQHKRKLAKEFENEIEQRSQQVAKKQKQVQGALDRMKAQGENLVPKSPRVSKSPKP